MSPRRKPTTLFGSIETRVLKGGVLVYRYIYRAWDPARGRKAKMRPIYCGQSLDKARMVQYEMTRRWLAGELERPDHAPTAPLAGYELVRRSDRLKEAKQGTSVEEFLAIWMRELAQDRRLDTTVAVETQENYKRDKSLVTRFWNCMRVARTGELTIEQARGKWTEKRMAQGAANATINREYGHLCKMFRFMHRHGYHAEDLASQISKRKERKGRKTIFPSLEFILDMFAAAATVSPKFLQFVWGVMKVGGRETAMTEIKKDDVSESERRICYYSGKENGWPMVKVDPDALDLFSALRKDPRNHTPFLFVDEEYQPWTATKLRRRMKRLRAEMREKWGKATVARVVKWHTMRHTLGSAWTKMHGVAQASTMLGHGSVQLTMDYYVNVNIEYIDKDAKVLPWSLWSVHGDVLGDVRLTSGVFRSLPSSRAETGAG